MCNCNILLCHYNILLCNCNIFLCNCNILLCYCNIYSCVTVIYCCVIVVYCCVTWLTGLVSASNSSQTSLSHSADDVDFTTQKNDGIVQSDPGVKAQIPSLVFLDKSEKQVKDS